MIQITEKQLCVGCNACTQTCPKQCIAMHEDSEGFLYPRVDTSTCIECGLCEKVCPVIHQGEAHKPLAVYAAKNKNEEIRLKSSSGGIFTLLAEQTINNGGVVFGARFNKKWEVVHDYTETIEGIAPFRGSKYVQSRIGCCYIQARKFLKEKRQVLFSGTPCQIAGLKRFLQKEYDNLITVDFICHGVPSPMVFRRYLDEKICALAHSAGRNTVFLSPNQPPISLIRDIQFRDKREGWKKYSFSLVLSAPNGAEQNSVFHSETLYKNIFMRGFLRDIYLRPSCYACPTKRAKSGSDITIADYWGIQDIHPEMDDDMGTSLVVINTPKGVTHYTNIQVAQVQSKTNAELAFKNNPSIYHSVNMPSNRPTFYKQLASANVDTLIKRYTKLSYKSRFKSMCLLLITKIGVKEQLKKMIR